MKVFKCIMLKSVCIIIFALFCSVAFAQKPFNDISIIIEKGIFNQNVLLLKRAERMLAKITNDDSKTFIYHFFYAKLKYQIAVLMLGKNKKNKAIAEIEKAIVYIKNSIKVKNNFSDSHRLYADCLGMYIALKGIYAGAQYGPLVFKELKIAKKLDDKNPLVYQSFGVSYLKTPKPFGGSVVKAINSLKIAISLNKKLYEAHTWLAIAYKENGNVLLSEKHFKIAIRLNPNYYFAKYEFDKLKKNNKKQNKKNKSTNNSTAEMSISGNIIFQALKSVEGDSVFPILQFKYFNNYLWNNDARLILFFMGPVTVINAEKRHICNTRFNIEMQYLMLLLVGGNTFYDSKGNILNTYSGHSFDYQISPGFWIIDEKLKLYGSYRLNYNIYNKEDKTSLLPEDSFSNTIGFGLSYNTLFYLGNDNKEGVYFSANIELASNLISEDSKFIKYYFDFQKNMFLSLRNKLYFMARGGIVNGVNTPEEKKSLFQIGSGFQQVVNTYAYIIHGLSFNEFLAERFLLFNLAYRFPLGSDFSMEIALDYGLIKETNLERNVFGSGVKLFVECFPSFPFYLLAGAAYNAKREKRTAIETGIVVKKIF